MRNRCWAFILFSVLLPTNICCAQIEWERLDKPVQHAIQLNDSFLQKIASFYCQFETQFKQRGPVKKPEDEGTFLHCEIWKLGSGHRVKTMSSLRFQIDWVDQLSLDDGSEFKSIRFKDPDTLSRITPCEQLGLRAFQSVFTGDFLSVQLQRLMLFVPDYGPRALSLSELISKKGVHVKHLGEKVLDGKTCIGLGVAHKIEETQAVETHNVWVDLESGIIRLLTFEDGSCFLLSESLDIPGVGEFPSTVSCYRHYGDEKQYMTSETTLKKFQVSHAMLDDPDLGFRYPKYSCVLYREKIADGTLDDTFEFRIVGESNDDILFRTKDKYVALNDWCMSQGLPGNDLRLPLTASLRSNWLMPLFSIVGIIAFLFFIRTVLHLLRRK